jgi:hypothetical protein
MFDEEPSHFHALMTGVAIGALGMLFWVVVVWVSR